MNFESLIGNTPLVQLENLGVKPTVKLYAKLEGNNPGGSVKDRAALGMIRGALERGEIKEGSKLVEATSGNTGIALAMIASRFKVKMTLLMPASATRERVLTMKAYGAKVILTPADKTIEHSREVAFEMAATGDYYLLNQFDNPDNSGMHFKTTGPEIWRDTKGEVTHFVSSMGTTGTIMGVSKYLKSQNEGVQIVGTQPTEGSRIPGIRRWKPAFLPKIFDGSRLDRIVDVSTEEATSNARALASKEGVFGGMSTGGALTVALKIANEIEFGTIVFINCDRGDRYLSTDLFD